MNKVFQFLGKLKRGYLSVEQSLFPVVAFLVIGDWSLYTRHGYLSRSNLAIPFNCFPINCSWQLVANPSVKTRAGNRGIKITAY